jgi:hypothetical protein
MIRVPAAAAYDLSGNHVVAWNKKSIAALPISRKQAAHNLLRVRCQIFIGVEHKYPLMFAAFQKVVPDAIDPRYNRCG